MITAQLTINLKENKVLSFSKHRKKGLKRELIWNLDDKPISQVNSYKYLGFQLDQNLNFNHQLDQGKIKAKQLHYAFKTLVRKLKGCSTGDLLKVIAAKFIPTISYGSELMNTKDAAALNQAQSSLFKSLFSIPRYISQSQIRLEYRLKNQKPARQRAMAKYYWRMRQAEENTLAHS